jgi:hypothetical protein
VPQAGYLKAVWLYFGVFCLRSGRPREPGKAGKSLEGEAAHLFEGLPGLPGPARLQKRIPKQSGQLAFKYPDLDPGIPGARVYLALGHRPVPGAPVDRASLGSSDTMGSRLGS